MNKIGILSGTFDPIHVGHVAFAKVAMQEAGLDTVYILIEPKPRRKTGVTNYQTRKQMVELAVQNESNVEMLEIGDKQFDVGRTLPKLQTKFSGCELFILIGDDVLTYLPSWPKLNVLSNSVTFVVAKRSSGQNISQLPDNLKLQFISLDLPVISSSQIRNSNSNKHQQLLHPAVVSFIAQNKLYKP
jgi:nicotinate-nucleotide adenylyltransferase